MREVFLVRRSRGTGRILEVQFEMHGVWESYPRVHTLHKVVRIALGRGARRLWIMLPLGPADIRLLAVEGVVGAHDPLYDGVADHIPRVEEGEADSLHMTEDLGRLA